MLWLLLQSTRHNARQYWLAIVGVAAAVLVATLGISASQAIWRMAQYPILQVLGGDLVVADASLKFYASGVNIHSNGDMGTVAGAETLDLIRTVLPEARTSQTLFVPAIVNGQSAALQGRLDDSENWLFMPRIVEGQQLRSRDDANELVVSQRRSTLTPGQAVSVRMCRALFRNGGWVWSLADGTTGSHTVTGVYGQPDPNGNPWLPLRTAQRWTGIGDRATYVGVRVDDPARLADAVARLRGEITARDLPLQVITARDMAGLIIADYARLESLSGYYIPAMCVIAVLIVVATGLVLASSRRRELSLLRSIGLSIASLRLLFVGECLLVVLLGAAAGTVLAALTTASMFRYAVWNPLPALTVFSAALLLSVPSAFILFSRSGALRALRNP